MHIFQIIFLTYNAIRVIRLKIRVGYIYYALRIDELTGLKYAEYLHVTVTVSYRYLLTVKHHLLII